MDLAEIVKTMYIIKSELAIQGLFRRKIITHAILWQFLEGVIQGKKNIGCLL